MASFQGLRLAFTSIEANNYYIRLLLANGVEDVLDISQAPNTDQEGFLAWWVTEKERAAREEKKILVVCNSYEQSCHRKWLKLSKKRNSMTILTDRQELDSRLYQNFPSPSMTANL